METNEIINDSAIVAEASLQPEKGQSKRTRKRSIIIFSVVTLVNVALLSLILWQLLTPRSGAVATNTTTVGEISSPLIGQKAPAFTLQALNGSPAKLSLSKFAGKPVIINFWATWCGPCNDEAPVLEQGWSGLQTRGVMLLGVDQSDESLSAVHSFFQKYSITYPNVQDDTSGNVSVAYGLIGQPETFFVDKTGKVVSVWIGGMTADNMRTEVTKLLQE